MPFMARTFGNTLGFINAHLSVLSIPSMSSTCPAPMGVPVTHHRCSVERRPAITATWSRGRGGRCKNRGGDVCPNTYLCPAILAIYNIDNESSTIALMCDML